MNFLKLATNLRRTNWSIQEKLARNYHKRFTNTNKYA